MAYQMVSQLEHSTATKMGLPMARKSDAQAAMMVLQMAVLSVGSHMSFWDLDQNTCCQ